MLASMGRPIRHPHTRMDTDNPIANAVREIDGIYPPTRGPRGDTLGEVGVDWY